MWIAIGDKAPLGEGSGKGVWGFGEAVAPPPAAIFEHEKTPPEGGAFCLLALLERPDLRIHVVVARASGVSEDFRCKGIFGNLSVLTPRLRKEFVGAK